MGTLERKMREELDVQRVKIARNSAGQAGKASQAGKPRQAGKVTQEPPRRQPKAREADSAASAAGNRANDALHREGRPKGRKLSILDQWVEVEIREGETVTTLFPSNAELIRESEAMNPPPDLVYRRFHFPNGVPAEYGWAAGGAHPERRKRGGMGTQRMTLGTWRKTIEREEANASGHLGPTGTGNLPRPKERGGCDCEVCTHNRELIESGAI